MAIKYYPNRVYKKFVPAIDRELVKREPQIQRGLKDINADPLNVVISANDDWQFNSITFTFNNANARDFSAKVIGGRKVVENLNDTLWFQIDTTGPQNITLDPAFYTGSQLAAHLQAQLDANTDFADQGVTFTVAYNAATGFFTVTPSSGSIRYLDVNVAQTLSARDSIAGHLFGFNADTAFAGGISSDTPVFGLNAAAPIINETASVLTAFRDDTVHILDIDEAVKLESNAGVDVVINWAVNWEEIV